MVKRLEGGCQVPIAAYAVHQKNSAGEDELFLQALVASENGEEIIRKSISGSRRDAEEIGTKLAEQLIADGADKLLAALR